MFSFLKGYHLGNDYMEMLDKFQAFQGFSPTPYTTTPSNYLLPEFLWGRHLKKNKNLILNFHWLLNV